MTTTQKDLETFRQALQKGSLQKVYRELISFMMNLRMRFVEKYGEPNVSGMYQGYMDMTYFACFPSFLKCHGLKVAIVFNYDAFRFEAWLAARNRKIQQQYWEIFRDTSWAKYRVVAPASGVDSILEVDLATTFDITKPEDLSRQILEGTEEFIKDIENFLDQRHPV